LFAAIILASAVWDPIDTKARQCSGNQGTYKERRQT